MLRLDDTIVALSTAPGVGAISLIRLSGPQTEEVLLEIFTFGGAANKALNTPGSPKFKDRVATLGHIVDPETHEIIDEVIVTFFRGPRSYTGEDLAEIACHGSPVITQELLSLFIRRGLRLAGRGEFTQRAFVNGRMDLTQAEAVLDLIQSKTSKQSRRAVSALTGHLGQRITSVRADLVTLLTRIVAGIDFPEEIGDAPEPEIEQITDRCLSDLQELAKTARSGKFLREGLKVAIVGRPNAGKSSLLNQLLKFDRAIVTDIPGTTRDAIEETLDIAGVPVTLIDTAGIRETEDVVEKIGIERSARAIQGADLILLVMDLCQGWAAPEDQILALVLNTPFILVGNKVDVCTEFYAMSKMAEQPVAYVMISATTAKNITDLTSAIEAWVFKDNPIANGPSLNTRQAELCEKAAYSLRHVKETLLAGLPQDCLATDLKIAVDALSEISGELVSEEVISQVFATFCIGK